MSGAQWMVVLIVAIIMIASFLKASVRHGTQVAMQQPDPDAERMREEIRSLKDRIAVLERIATDRSSALEHEIEALRSRD